eukprot:GDKH01004194.1.p1 GENE.GDKH01004194.1~~GDKH01004194.1.p1  ORF type:complete len:295 (-),score=47.64 GDKH01004194.1:108-992(-)
MGKKHRVRHQILKKAKSTAKPQKVVKEPAKGVKGKPTVSSKKKSSTAPGLATTYKPTQRVLLVGEGNFSFAVALARKFAATDPTATVPLGLVCTAYDSESITCEKYDDARQFIDELRQLGADVRFSVDALKLASCLGLDGKVQKAKTRAAQQSESDTERDPEDRKAVEDAWKFDRIVFNFPHCGLGIKDQSQNIRANQTLLAGFFRSCMDILVPLSGEIHVALKLGLPYTEWKLPSVARSVSERLVLKTAHEFRPSDFPPYSHRRTLGFQEGRSKANNEELDNYPCRTYSWMLR